MRDALVYATYTHPNQAIDPLVEELCLTEQDHQPIDLRRSVVEELRDMVFSQLVDHHRETDRPK